MREVRSMKQLLFGIAIAALSATPGAQPPQGPVEALDGADPVLVVQGKDVLGKPDLRVVRGRYIYLFSTPGTKAIFEKDPEKYEIQLNGSCARMGPPTGGNPSDFYVHDGRIYIFGSDDCHKKFAAAPEKYLPRPVLPMPTAAAAVSAGKKLLDRAVAATGGAAAVDGLTSLTEVVSTSVPQRDGDVPATRTTIWRFPDAVRQETSATIMGQTRKQARVVTATAGFFASGERAFPMSEQSRVETAPQLNRHLIPLLRARTDAGAAAAALGRAKVAGLDVEQVRLTSRGNDVTLGIDPPSGRVVTIAYMDRTSGGEDAGQVGETVLVLSDYRTVKGLSLPFAVKALFDGKPFPMQTLTVQSIDVNTAIDSALFEAPKPPAKN
jgi:YHS domain-containing protein